MDSVSSPSDSSQPFFTPLLLSLVGVAGTSIVLVAYHLIVVRYCLRRRRRRANLRSLPTQDEQTGTGVEERVLKALPILSFSTEKGEGKSLPLDQSECVICLGELEEGDEVRLLPNCGHVFHVQCIDDWFSAHTSCPTCRAPLMAPLASMVSDLGREGYRPEQGNQGRGGGGEDDSMGDADCNVNVTTPQQSNGNALRHSVSFVLPVEAQSQQFMGMKRSLSMDHSFVIIDVRSEESENASCSCSCSCSSSSSSLKGGVVESKSDKAPSMSQLDRMSSRLLRSFSQMRVDHNVVIDSDIP